MSDIHIIAVITKASGILIVALALPLIYRRVPRNGIYGIRTRASFASDSDWYRINAIGGRYLALSGVVIALTGIAGFFLPSSAFRSYSIAAAAITLLAIFIPCVRLCFMKPKDGPAPKS